MSTLIRQRVAAMSPAERLALQRMWMPRLVEPYIKHIPHPTQMAFLGLSHKKEVMFGGAAGGGKSDALLMSALQYVDVPGYSALLLRKTWPDLVLPGAIMDRARQWLDDTPAHPREGGRIWVFPSGARLQFGYLQNDKDKYRYQSAEFQFIGFDELTHWAEESTYDYLFSRLRKPTVSCLTCKDKVVLVKKPNGSSQWKHTTRSGRSGGCGKVNPDHKVIRQYPPSKSDGTTLFEVPLRMRSATNPGGVGNDWVKRRFIDPRTKSEKAYFVPSKLSDNPSVDPSYRESLSYLNEVDRLRLENGDWEVTEAGEMFDRADFIYTDVEPQIVKKVRFWDMASSQNTGDYTVGCLMGLKTDGKVVILDIQRFQKHPHGVEKHVRATAAVDGIDTYVRQEQEPGSSGVMVIEHYRRNVFNGYMYDGVRSTGSKEARAKAYASYAKAGNVEILLGQWNRDFLNEHEQFPNGAHDDIVDASSGAYNFLMLGRTARLIV